MAGVAATTTGGAGSDMGLGSLFTRAGRSADEDVQSVRDDTEVGPGTGAGGAVFRGDGAGRPLKGAPRPGADMRKYRYDLVRGRGKGMGFCVTRDDRMSASEAEGVMHRLHEIFGIDRETEDVLYAFDSALFFCHTVNGASVLGPGRSKFHVTVSGGMSNQVTREFDYAEVRNVLGDSLRRFFRAYADDVMEVNKRVLAEYDPNDPVRVEQRGWLMEVAHERGLMRYPYLAHDSADACLTLSAPERQALADSKVLVVGGTPNSADRMRPTGSPQSADAYDSSVGQTFTPARR